MTDRNLRIVSRNMVDWATITVASTAPGLGAEWLKTPHKSEVCRILSGEGTLTFQWEDKVGVDCVAVPAWNGSESSEIRARCYDEMVGGDLLWDSGWKDAAPGPPLGSWGFGQLINESTFTYHPRDVNGFHEGVTVSAVWVPNIAARRVVIDLRDPHREFLDIGNVVIGLALQICGASYGSNATTIDSSNVVRTAGNDIRIDKGSKRRAMTLVLDQVDPKHRQEIMRIINAGLGKRHFFSGFTDESDVGLMQELMMYGVLTTVPTLTHLNWGSDGTQFQVEEN